MKKQEHKREKHVWSKPYKCSHCNERFIWHNDWREHRGHCSGNSDIDE